jgi:hypothetical protein
MRRAARLLPEAEPARMEEVVLVAARAAWRAAPHHRLAVELGIALVQDPGPPLAKHWRTPIVPSLRQVAHGMRGPDIGAQTPLWLGTKPP